MQGFFLQPDAMRAGLLPCEPPPRVGASACKERFPSVAGLGWTAHSAACKNWELPSFHLDTWLITKVKGKPGGSLKPTGPLQVTEANQDVQRKTVCLQILEKERTQNRINIC